MVADLDSAKICQRQDLMLVHHCIGVVDAVPAMDQQLLHARGLAGITAQDRIDTSQGQRNSHILKVYQ